MCIWMDRLINKRKNRPMRIFIGGDIMPGGVLPYQETYIDEGLKAMLSQYDFRVGTLECAIGDGLPFDDEKIKGRANIIYARTEDLSRVKELGFDVVSLANNHVFDLGVEGLRNTMQQLTAMGIQYCGAGMNLDEASRPALVSKDGMTIAFLAYCMYDSPWLGQVRLAEENVPGISPLDITKVVEDIRMAKKNYDKVVVLPHWGKEYSYEPLPETIEIAKQMVQAGADAVIGTHPHQVQPMIKIKGVPVCFSMGNFLFPDFYMQPPRPIWYPDADIDRATIPSVDSYIFPVEKPVLRVWEPLSRYGMSVDVRLSPHHRISVNPVFTHLSYNNNLCKSGPAKGMRSRLWKESAKIKCSWIRGMSESLRQRKREKLQKQ